MEEPSSINRNETPAGNFAGRRRRHQQDCTVKLFPPITPSKAVPSTNQEPETDTKTDVNFRDSHKCRSGCHTCCCCSCKSRKHKKQSGCNSRLIDSALSSCSSRSSTASSWLSCSSRSSWGSSSSADDRSFGDSRNSLRALPRSREVKDVLKRIAEELASDDGGGGIGRNGNVKNGRGLGDLRGDPRTPPPSRVLTGGHFLDWYIPRHIAGSRALNRSDKKSAAAKQTQIASPLHKPEKQAWVTQIINPKTTSLPLPDPPKPPVLDHPCPRADNLWEAFSKDQINVNPFTYASHLANTNYLSNSFPPPRFSAIRPPQSALASKSLRLQQGKKWYQAREGFPQPGAGEPLSGPIFSKSQVPNKTWFVVHPDWRLEPSPGEDL